MVTGLRALIIAGLSAAGLAGCGGGDPELADAANEAAASPSSSTIADINDAAIEAVTPVDYATPAAWLCRPDRDDACDVDVSDSAVATDGSVSVRAAAANPEADIDCFYVYPTVSEDSSPNSDVIAGKGETEAAIYQAARFGGVCRLYAPIYRQVTLSALRAMLAGDPPNTNREMAYADVRAAWRQYLETENEGRGVVLIGHSQGAGVLSRLLASEIAGTPSRGLIVSALLIGGNLSLDPSRPQDGLVGGFPLCEAPGQQGCIIAYSTYRATIPPREGALFGKASERGRAIACVNPAVLDGSGGRLHSLLPAGKVFESTAEPQPWTKQGGAIETKLVSLPGMLSAECVSKDGYAYLSVNVAGDGEDLRVDQIVGDVVLNGEIQPGWGLHVIDVNLALGNLVDVVRMQAETRREVLAADDTTTPEQ